HNVCILSTTKNNVLCVSIALILKPSGESKFTPIYLCREGITIQTNKLSKRLQLVEKTVQEMIKVPHRLEVKHSSYFAEPALYHQYLTGILRLHHILPPLS
ncbi:MAG: methylthioribose kinase, partial [Firmicutes bacterium]|nr:methylthioribose kinase [Bacillota bacterium]